MGDPLTSNQHGYVKRALNAFETVAKALERIANSLEASAESKAEADTKSDTVAEVQRTKIEPSGRYDELAIEDVPAQSAAIDYDQDPPELLVHADSVRHPTPANGECPTYILELPTIETETPGSEN
jgi:hypothetical protein